LSITTNRVVARVIVQGRFTEAREEIQRAITRTQNLREQELLTERCLRGFLQPLRLSRGLSEKVLSEKAEVGEGAERPLSDCFNDFECFCSPLVLIF
jgi:hypothetical protein